MAPRPVSQPTKPPKPLYVYLKNWKQYGVPEEIDTELLTDIMGKVALYQRWEYCPFGKPDDCEGKPMSDVVRKIVQDALKNRPLRPVPIAGECNPLKGTALRGNIKKVSRNNQIPLREKNSLWKKEILSKGNSRESGVFLFNLDYFDIKNLKGHHNRKKNTNIKRVQISMYNIWDQ